MKSYKNTHSLTICKSETLESDSNIIQVEGFVTVYENEDSYGDIIKTGAFGDSIKSNPIVKLNLDHSYKVEDTIGEITLEEGSTGVWGKGFIDLGLPKVKNELLPRIKNKSKPLVDGFSIGFTSDDMIYNCKTSGFIFNKGEIGHVAIVTYPANPLARISMVKGENEYENFIKDLESIDNQDTFNFFIREKLNLSKNEFSLYLDKLNYFTKSRENDNIALTNELNNYKLALKFISKINKG